MGDNVVGYEPWTYRSSIERLKYGSSDCETNIECFPQSCGRDGEALGAFVV